MAYEAAHLSPEADEDDFRLPGLDIQHELLLSLPSWESAAPIMQRLADVGAGLHALSLSPQAGRFVLKCRVHAISPARARAFVAGLGEFADGPAVVEHLILAKACDHARA